jgi:hypothetical protein
MRKPLFDIVDRNNGSAAKSPAAAAETQRVPLSHEVGEG